MKIIIYGKPNCGGCKEAINLCEKKGVDYVYKQLGKDFDLLEMYNVAPRNHKSFPCLSIIEEYDGVEMHEQYLGDLNKLQQMLCGS